MVKRIIFDIDNTLIPWNNEWWNTIKVTFYSFGLECDDILQKKFLQAAFLYEKNTRRFSEIEMGKFISDEIGIELPDEFIFQWEKELFACVAEVDLELVECIKYLASKYDLCVATNWFTDQQVERLKRYGIYEYFSEIIGCDQYNLKPDLEMYTYLSNGFLPGEVVMVGDSFTNDIEPALKLGIYCFYVTEEEKKTRDNLYMHIKSVKELRKIL